MYKKITDTFGKMHWYRVGDIGKQGIYRAIYGYNGALFCPLLDSIFVSLHGNEASPSTKTFDHLIKPGYKLKFYYYNLSSICCIIIYENDIEILFSE